MPTDSKKPTVRFYLNGEYREVENILPTTTVLNFLREQLQLFGTKEGCAEGDCGACTVVIAENHKGRLRFRNINACIQFVPVLDGKLIFTVEGLKDPDLNELHPVQEAMVAAHGSQCGFCTPGFVMSLFALFKSEANPQRASIDDALAGNLCRCTGYRPIIDAAAEMYEIARKRKDVNGNYLSSPARAIDDDEIPEKERVLLEQLDSIKPERELIFNDSYFAPTTIKELTTRLKEHPDATILAGGTDVGLWVTKQHRDLPVMIYLGQIAALQEVKVNKDHLRIAAGVSLTDAFTALLVYYPELSEICRRFASPPIRNTGTLCGNIANGSPIGDSMPALISMDATIQLTSASGAREIALDSFYLDYQLKDLQSGEFVEAVNIPLPASDQIVRSYKISKRFDQDISAVCAAFSISLSNNVIKNARVCFGGMAAIPLRAENCESALEGQELNDSVIEKAIGALADDFTPLSDMRATKEYRLRVAGNLLKRFYYELSDSDVAVDVLSVAG